MSLDTYDRWMILDVLLFVSNTTTKITCNKAYCVPRQSEEPSVNGPVCKCVSVCVPLERVK